MRLVNHINYSWLRWFPEHHAEGLRVRAYFTYKTEPHSVTITKVNDVEYAIQIKGQHRSKFQNDVAVLEYLRSIAEPVYKAAPVETVYVPTKHRTVYAKLNATPY